MLEGGGGGKENRVSLFPQSWEGVPWVPNTSRRRAASAPARLSLSRLHVRPGDQGPTPSVGGTLPTPGPDPAAAPQPRPQRPSFRSRVRRFVSPEGAARGWGEGGGRHAPRLHPATCHQPRRPRPSLRARPCFLSAPPPSRRGAAAGGAPATVPEPWSRRRARSRSRSRGACAPAQGRGRAGRGGREGGERALSGPLNGALGVANGMGTRGAPNKTSGFTYIEAPWGSHRCFSGLLMTA